MYYVIVNEMNLKGKRLKSLEKVEEVFRRAGKPLCVERTHYAGHAKELAEKITSDGENNTVIAMGGDGTLHEILNGFKDFEKNSLALIPSGTGNDFAACAGIPRDAETAARLIAESAPRKIDFIQLDSGLRSINAVGMGIDVDVLKRTYSKKKTGKFKYLFSFIACLMKFKSYDFEVEYDGKRETRHGLLAAVGNGRQIGGGIKVFPEAKIDDGKLELVVVDFISRFKTIGAFIKLMRGKINKVKQVTAVKVDAVKFTPTNKDYVIQAEGELYENMPFSAHIEKDKLNFYLP